MGFNLPDKKFLDVAGTEKEVFGPEGRAADTTGYESEEGPAHGFGMCFYGCVSIVLSSVYIALFSVSIA